MFVFDHIRLLEVHAHGDESCRAVRFINEGHGNISHGSFVLFYFNFFFSFLLLFTVLVPCEFMLDILPLS